MVGGIVIGVVRNKINSLVHVQGTGCEKRNSCSVRVKDQGLIQLGDSIWWQAGNVMWTPLDNSTQDKKFPKIGYSH